MKKLLKGLLYTIIFVLLIVVIAVSYITLALPNVGKPENISIVPTPGRIAYGKYLVEHVVLCTDCHSKSDSLKFAGPVLEGSLGGGGRVFDGKVGFPGDVIVPNITSYNLKSWTDGEIFRAITTGVRKDGSAIFPLMPWPYYAKMSREDLYSVIAYLRTLKPISSSYPRSKLNFPLNIVVHTMPQKAALGVKPFPADTVNYGRYLANSAGCGDCHSQSKNGAPLAGLEFAGGHEYKVNNNCTVRSSNITSDMTTGIGSWTADAFVQRFKAYNDPSKAAKVAANDFQTIMPWYDYAGMKESDLRAIYAYLKTLKPVKNRVYRFSAAVYVASKN